ncbi:MAG: PTS system mannose/fructose/sorbose family transporter subunit IID [Oscillospiraceae bacterium]|nr:PTS system mannose/fructose/sorbose family transporter subunit IID [Oscillospiraceae bacterium]
MTIGITLFQAVLLGLCFFLFRFTQLGYSIGGPFFFSPLPMSLIVGIVLGDVEKAMIIGAALQMIYLGIMGPGATTPQDPSIAALIGTSLGISAGIDVNVAVALAVPVGLIGRQLGQLVYMANIYCLHVGDRHAEKGNIRGVVFSGAVLPQIAKFILTIPLIAVIYLGPTYAESIINSVPEWLMNGFSIVGGLLPAVGLAIIIRVIGKKALLPYFAIGFLAVQYLGIPILPLSIIGVITAYLHLMFTGGLEGVKIEASSDEKPEVKHILSRRDISQSHFMWWLFGMATHNYERLQAHTFAIAMCPIIKKLYKTTEDISSALKRHMAFFNTEIAWGSIVPGVTIALEEQRAMGADIPESAISGIKTGLMGPFAGIGDTLTYGTLLPITLALFIPLAANGNWLGAVAPVIIFGAIVYFLSFFLYHYGYKMGSNSALNILKSNMINSIIIGASVLGLIMMGGLAGEYVEVSTPLSVITTTSEYPIQEVLDSILLGLLPLLTITGVYLLLNKIKTRYIYAIGIIFVVGLTLGGLGILA